MVKIDRLMLHAGKLGFTHPGTEKYMEFETPLPEEMKRVLDKLNRTEEAMPEGQKDKETIDK